MKLLQTDAIDILNIKALVYGKSGVGKTFSALTLNEKKTLIISAESGLLPLRGKKFDVWEPEVWTEMLEIYQELLKAENIKKYDNVFIDSLTELNEMLKEQIVKKDRPALGKDLGKVYDDLMTMQDWNLLGVRLSRFIRMYRDLPYNVIFTALEDVHKNEQTGAETFTPSINGKLALNLAGYFDEVFRLLTKEEEDGKITRYFLTDKTERSIAKDRSGSLEKFEGADWKVIFNKIKSIVKEKKNV